MTELYFPYGSMDGFTSSTTADRQEGLDIPIRELMQNSLDATTDGTECRVEITIDEISIGDIPHIDSYRQYLHKAVETQKELNAYKRQQEMIVENIESELNKKKIPVLLFTDNGNGMDSKILDSLIEHRSSKREGSGGSFGVGHLKAYDLSSLRYVLYASRREETTLFTGVPILAGFQDTDAKRGNVGRILNSKPEDEANPCFDYPNDMPQFMARAMGDRGHGSIIGILGLSDKWGDDFETAIANHFFSAILHERLSVCIHRKNRKDNVILDQGIIEKVLMEGRDRQRRKRRRGEILSGSHTWQSYLAVRDSSATEIQLSNDDRVNIYIHTEDISASSVALIRSDMLIARHDSMLVSEFDTLRKSEDVARFSLVIDVNQAQAGKELFGLVKAAEGPYHNSLNRGQLNNGDERRLRELLAELAGKVRERLPKIEREGFELPIFDSVDAAVGGNRRAKRVERFGISPPGKGQRKRGGGGGGNSPRPPMFGRPAEARVEARAERREDRLRVRVRITPLEDTHPRDSAMLSFCVAEDRDDSIAGDRFTPESVLVNGSTEILNDQTVPLGRLAKHARVVVEAVLALPPGSAQGMTVGVLPLVSLKRERPSETEGDAAKPEDAE